MPEIDATVSRSQHAINDLPVHQQLAGVRAFHLQWSGPAHPGAWTLNLTVRFDAIDDYYTPRGHHPMVHCSEIVQPIGGIQHHRGSRRDLTALQALTCTMRRAPWGERWADAKI